MSNPNAAAAGAAAKPVEKTPSYAWACLAVSLLAAVSIVFAWMWLPGITFPVFKNWLAANNPLFQNPANFSLLSNVMGLVPIGALIMALPTTFIVRKWGAKVGTLAGLALSIIGTAISAATVGSNFYAFLAGRFILGLGLSTTVVSGPTCVSIWFPDSTRGRAMAIWSCWAPIGIFLSNFVNDSVYNLVGQSMNNLQWAWCALIVVVAIAFAVLFRAPRENERSQVSPERKPLKDVLVYFKSRQLWCLIIMFVIFNYMNYAFSQYLKTWLQTPELLGGFGWDAATAGLWGGLICACGALAPIGGLILDKTPRDKKYICVVVGIIGLTICSALAFKAEFFIPYVLFFCIGNMMLNACCRPLVPTFVFRGGQTAVAFGLSLLTLGQYAGQIATSYVLAPFNEGLTAASNVAINAKVAVLAGGGTPADFGPAIGAAVQEAIGQGIHVDPMLAFWALVPVGVVGIILSLGVKPAKKPAGAGKPEGKPAA
ncbi:nitrate/nitrite transporter [Adlercreutzia sp. ZJ242]|uniref:MFS transporter n=1 Tax=Adlercreutzia sp. ZJ242 TaxID=2709409 RepID=UPI0013EB8FF3|nr:MFS transporter [Adlercreutzia sp. ZJ242]